MCNDIRTLSPAAVRRHVRREDWNRTKNNQSSLYYENVMRMRSKHMFFILLQPLLNYFLRRFTCDSGFKLFCFLFSNLRQQRFPCLRHLFFKQLLRQPCSCSSKTFRVTRPFFLQRDFPISAEAHLVCNFACTSCLWAFLHLHRLPMRMQK